MNEQEFLTSLSLFCFVEDKEVLAGIVNQRNNIDDNLIFNYVS